MPSTLTGVAIGAASGGAIGGLLGHDYAVVMGAVIGALASVVASKDNNGRKVVLFLLAFFCGVLVASPLSEIIKQVCDISVDPRVAALLAAAFAIPVIILVSNPENLRAAIKWASSIISKRLGGG